MSSLTSSEYYGQNCYHWDLEDLLECCGIGCGWVCAWAPYSPECIMCVAIVCPICFLIVCDDWRWECIYCGTMP